MGAHDQPADPAVNRIVVLDIADNGTFFTAARRELRSRAFDRPMDLAPATREISHGSFASNTTLGGGSDIFVLNRGYNLVLRMTLNGKVVARRRVLADLRGFRLNGIAISSASQTTYLTATTPGSGGALLSIPAFAVARSSNEFFTQGKQAGAAGDMNTFGRFLFALDVTPAQGLGPLFNDQSCGGCHSSPSLGGMSLHSGQDVNIVGRINHKGQFDNLLGHGGPIARIHSVAELGIDCNLPTGIPHQASVIALRNAMSLRGDGQLDTISEGDILANMAAEPPDVRGRPNLLSDGRLGKFGWKAHIPTLVEFMAEAYRNELGVTSPLRTQDEVHGCAANKPGPDVDAFPLQATAKFLNTIDPPDPAPACANSPGAAIFRSIGCAGCHTPSLPGPGARQALNLYSDLLLHDMGAALNDGIEQGSAHGNEWRTAPLWRVSERGKFLHDGRAVSFSEAIAAHGGQAQSSRDAFNALDSTSRQALLDFLGCI